MPKLIVLQKHRHQATTYPQSFLIAGETSTALNYVTGKPPKETADHLAKRNGPVPNVTMEVNQRRKCAEDEEQTRSRRAVAVRAEVATVTSQQGGKWEVGFRLIWKSGSVSDCMVLYSVVVKLDGMCFGKTDYYPRAPRASAPVPEKLFAPVVVAPVPQAPKVDAPVAKAPVVISPASRGMKRKAPAVQQPVVAAPTTLSTAPARPVEVKPQPRPEKRVKMEHDMSSNDVIDVELPVPDTDLKGLLRTGGTCHYNALYAVCIKEHLFRIRDLSLLTRDNVKKIYESIPCGPANEFLEVVKIAKESASATSPTRVNSNQAPSNNAATPLRSNNEAQVSSAPSRQGNTISRRIGSTPFCPPGRG